MQIVTYACDVCRAPLANDRTGIALEGVIRPIDYPSGKILGNGNSHACWACLDKALAEYRPAPSAIECEGTRVTVDSEALVSELSQSSQPMGLSIAESSKIAGSETCQLCSRKYKNKDVMIVDCVGPTCLNCAYHLIDKIFG